MLGRLTLNAIPLINRPLVAGAVVILIVLASSHWVAIKGYVPYLWREWFTSVDHKRIGVMYIVLALLMLLRGFIDAIMMRSQQAFAFRRPAICRPSISIRSSRRTARS